MESINTINKTLFGVALAVLALAMAVPQGTALAGGMNIHTADLCNVADETLFEYYSGAIGTVAAVTDKRTRISPEPWTAWAVSLEGMLEENGYYGVYNDSSEPPESREPCEGDPVYVMPTPNGIGFENLGSEFNPEVGNTVWICRMLEEDSFPVGTDAEFLIPILKGVLVKGGKERNKPNRC